MKAILSTEIELEIPFHDDDSMGITCHGNYLRYFEIARCKLLDRFDYGYSRMQESGYAWPIVDLQLKYVKPSRFEQKILVSAALVEWENRLKLNYQICDATSGERLTKGYTIQAAVDMQTQELCLVTPPVFRERLAPFIAAAEAKP